MLFKVPDKAHAFLDKHRVAHCERFIDDQNVGVHMCDDGKGQPHDHAGRIGFDRLVDKCTNISKRQHLFGFFCELCIGDAIERCGHAQVFQPRKFWVKACAKFE